MEREGFIGQDHEEGNLDFRFGLRRAYLSNEKTPGCLGYLLGMKYHLVI